MPVLDFETLRDANRARVKRFKNAKGELAHKDEGADWSFFDWGMATLGEMGELMEVRIQYQLGEISREEYVKKATKEFADIQTYLDLWAMRGLDGREKAQQIDVPFVLAWMVRYLGIFANNTKKLFRGDFSYSEWKERAELPLQRTEDMLRTLRLNYGKRAERQPESVDPNGIDLGQATVDKFNEVSDRVGAGVHLLTVKNAIYEHESYLVFENAEDDE